MTPILWNHIWLNPPSPPPSEVIYGRSPSEKILGHTILKLWFFVSRWTLLFTAEKYKSVNKKASKRFKKISCGMFTNAFRPFFIQKTRLDYYWFFSATFCLICNILPIVSKKLYIWPLFKSVFTKELEFLSKINPRMKW